MKLLPIAAVAGALALGGCSSLQSLLSGDSLAQTAPVASVDAEKALAVAHLAYQAAGVTLEQAAESGALKGEDAHTAQALFDKAGAALDAADAADAALNAQGVIEAMTEAETAIAELESLIKK
jgi:hypothetical protein